VATAKRKAPAKKRAPAKRKTKNGLSVKWKIVLAGLALIFLSPFYYGYVLKAFSSTWRWIRDAVGNNDHYRIYTSFNIRMPEKYKVCGIDVSSYQSKIDWGLVKGMHEDSVHISFAFIKATEGVLLVDPYFQRNWREAPKAGIMCGAYHFFRPRLSGKWQARFFLQTVKTEKGDLPMVVDIEQLDGVQPAAMRKELGFFLKYVESQTKIKPIIYSGLTFYQDYLQGHFDDYTLWLAHYYQPDLKVSKTANWKFWQHSDKARVNGINHVVDFNVFNGDSLSFRKMLVH
jgi:lysozyme